MYKTVIIARLLGGRERDHHSNFIFFFIFHAPRQSTQSRIVFRPVVYCKASAPTNWGRTLSRFFLLTRRCPGWRRRRQWPGPWRSRLSQMRAVLWAGRTAACGWCRTVRWRSHLLRTDLNKSWTNEIFGLDITFTVQCDIDSEMQRNVRFDSKILWKKSRTPSNRTFANAKPFSIWMALCANVRHCGYCQVGDCV